MRVTELGPGGGAGDDRIELPPDLLGRLLAFRTRLRRVKLAEVLAAAVAALGLSYLAVFISDRFWDTPALLRFAVLLVGTLGFTLFLPLAIRRWVVGSRSLAAVARILTRQHPHTGDRLLGIVELAQKGAGGDSPALCRAAIAQVADDTKDVDFSDAVPRPRHRQRAWAAGLVGLVGLGALAVPGAGTNALGRWLLPFSDRARHTFAKLEEAPARLVVPLGESFEYRARLACNTSWEPESATLRLDGLRRGLEGRLAGTDYVFEVPAQTKPNVLHLRVGDARRAVRVDPLPRPELVSLEATVTLPDYLEREPQVRDARTGRLALLRGSRVEFRATLSRALRKATIDGAEVAVDGTEFRFVAAGLTEDASRRLAWTDVEGLAPRKPFELGLQVREDEAPFIECRGLVSDRVVIDHEVTGFDLLAEDDFGVRRVGMSWKAVPQPGREETTGELPEGELVLAAGGPATGELEAQGTFCARQLSLPAGTYLVRGWVEDYRPDGERVQSPAYRIHVLAPDEHMMWVTRELEKWKRQALEVRDEEERLLDRNQELHAMNPKELAAARSDLERQMAAERANGRRLEALTARGQALIAQAARNEQFNAQTLETWAKNLAVLEKLASERMPGVATLLADAAEAARAGREQLAQAGARDGAPRAPGQPQPGPPDAGQPQPGQPGSGQPQPGQPQPGGAGKPSEGSPGAGALAKREGETPERRSAGGANPGQPGGKSHIVSEKDLRPVEDLGGPEAGKPGPKPEPGERMPSVARTSEGQKREGPPGEAGPPPVAPGVGDQVASANRDPEAERRDDAKKPDPGEKKPSGRLGLVETTLQDSAPPPAPRPNPNAPPGDRLVEEKLAEAVKEQKELLAQFDSVMDDIAEVLKNLTGSTFVKRLKRAARREKELASALESELEASFGLKLEVEEGAAPWTALAADQDQTSVEVAYLKDDLRGYFERTEEAKFDKVEKEMESTKVVGGMKLMATELDDKPGETIALADHWVDQLDRWADLLVGPG